MAQIQLNGKARDEFGKGAARRLRRDDMIPAVVYGHGTETQHIALPHHQTLLALRQANILLEIDLDGQRNFLALPKAIQRDPIRGNIEHLDLIIVKRGEKVTVEVPVVVTGEAASETLVMQDLNTISVEADATNIPTEFSVSVEGLEAGTQILAGAVELTEGATLVTDPEALVVNIAQAISAEALAAELEVPEGEGVESGGDEAADEGEAAAAGKDS